MYKFTIRRNAHQCSLSMYILNEPDERIQIFAVLRSTHIHNVSHFATLTNLTNSFLKMMSALYI